MGNVTTMDFCHLCAPGGCFSNYCFVHYGMKKSIGIDTNTTARIKNLSEHYIGFSQHLRPWLSELSIKCKESGYFQVTPMSVITSFYDDVRDKEIAAYACLHIREPYGKYERVLELRELIGEHPWKWFEQRMFVPISHDEDFYHATGGIRNCLLAKVFENLWKECSANNCSSVYDAIHGMMKRKHLSYYETLAELIGSDQNDYKESIRLFLVVLGTSDGIGCGAWSIEQGDTKCPLSHELRQFLKLWFPNYLAVGADKAIQLLGFDRGSDFLYAYWGWKELQKRNPKECARFAKIYNSRYESGIFLPPCRWKNILPQIDFG